MIPTLNIIAERAIRELSGGEIPNDSPYDIDYVIETARDAVNEDLKVEILKRRSGDEDDKSPIAQAIATYPNVAVTFDKPTGRAMAQLPDNFISLKRNKGVHSVSEMRKSLKTMIPIHNPQIAARLPHGDLEKDNYGYYLEGDKIFWMRDIIQEGIDKVLVKLIISAPAGLDKNAPLMLFPENLGRIVDLVKLRIQNKNVQDRLADNNPNIRALNEQQK